MNLALKEAERALEHNDVPVGAVIVHQGTLIAKAHNQVELLKDPTAHAEIMAITQAAAALKTKYLSDCTLYVTLEPCTMCAGAIILARIKTLWYGTHDEKLGACGSKFDVIHAPGHTHTVAVSSGLEAQKAEMLLKHFFVQIRKKIKE